MSTILQALQKSQLDQASSPAPILVNHSQPLYWKIAISAGLLIIIALLSILIYLQLTPRTVAQPVATVIETTPVITSTTEQESTPAPSSSTAAEKNNIVKIDFATQPLAPLPSKVQSTTPPVTINNVASPAATQQLLVSAEKSSSATAPTEPTLDEVAPSNALKERFEMAVLLSEIEENEQGVNEFENEFDSIEASSDSTDIHQMSGNFQNKVPIIEYQAHMYSSEQQDRWIRINNEVLREGQFDSSGELELLEIQPQRSIFRLQRQSFSIESLSDWKGY